MTLPTRLLAVLLLAGTTLLPAQVDESAAALSARRTSLHTSSLATPLTVHPVLVLGQPSTKVAEALALVLEKSGMSDLEVTTSAFTMAKETVWEDVPALFHTHLQKEKASATRHHLYAEFLGTPRTGPDEVRFVLVDGAGELVWSDRQTRTDADFRRTAAKDPDPLGCSSLVAERLFRLAEWKKAPGSVKDGKFAQLWRDKSGTPDAKELAAMKLRLAAMRESLHSARIAVLPTLAQGKHDADSSTRLAALLHQEVDGTFAAGSPETRLPGSQDSNEQKRLWDLTRSLQATLAKKPISEEYALVVDLGIDAEQGRGYVHTIVCTSKGELVLAAFSNDQSAVFQSIAPKTVQDAERVAVAMLRQQLR
jgi:hypothetical protein